MPTRRKFLKTGSLAIAGTAIFGKNIWATPNKVKELVGIQLYSVRSDMVKNPLNTLQQLAKMGYRNVEHANYVNRKFYGFTVSEFKKILNGLGMNMPSGHTVFRINHWDSATKDFTDEWKYTVEDAATMGQQFVISPSMEESSRKSYDGLMAFMELFNKCGELCKKSGMRFGYHNHDFEFSEMLNGKSLYDHILKETDPQLVIQQLDTGNLYNGGANAMEVVKKYPNRFLSVHVKDEIEVANGNERYDSTILGKGIVQLKHVIDAIRKNTKNVHYIIEQEAYQGMEPLNCAKENIKILKEWGYS